MRTCTIVWEVIWLNICGLWKAPTHKPRVCFQYLCPWRLSKVSPWEYFQHPKPQIKGLDLLPTLCTHRTYLCCTYAKLWESTRLLFPMAKIMKTYGYNKNTNLYTVPELKPCDTTLSHSAFPLNSLNISSNWDVTWATMRPSSLP